MKAIINIPAVQHILYVGGLVLLIWCFIQFGFIDYKDYVAGHFPLHLVIYGVCPIAIFATGAHWYEYRTLASDGDDRAIFELRGNTPHY